MLALAAGKYTVFGHIIDGVEVLDKMEKVPVGIELSLASVDYIQLLTATWDMSGCAL